MASSPPPTAPPGDIRERLFRVSMTGIRKKGYEGVPVSGITREAGVAKGTFFNHFPSKEHLLSEAFHRLVNEVLGEVAAGNESGTGAIMAFAGTLCRRLGGDPTLSAALLPRLASLPPSRPGEPREEARIRSWMLERLGETLPVTVPVQEVEPGTLAFLLVATLRATLEEWGHADGPIRPLEEEVTERMLFLLRSAGLPADPRRP